MAGHIYGYISDPSDGRAMEERLARMRSSGVSDEDIVIEAKGRNDPRPRLNRLLGRLRSGDTLVVEGIYGLGYNYKSISDTLKQLDRTGGVCVVLLDMPLLSDRSAADPLRPMLSELVTQTILYMIEHHRELRNSLQRRGIDTAKARGVQFGRPTVEPSGDYDSIVRSWRSGEITAEEAARSMHISRSTFFRRVKADVSP